jgi:microcystin-dependent protein
VVAPDGIKRHTPELEASLVCRVVSCDAALLAFIGEQLYQLTVEDSWLEVGSPISEVVQKAIDTLESYYSNLMIGSIVSFLGAVPQFYLALDGSTYQQADYPELAEVLDPQYKDDPSGTFTLPDVSGRFLLAQGGDYTLGQTGGESEHTLTVDELPAHAHNYTEPGPPAILGSNGPGVPTLNTITPNTPTTSVGANSPHNNMPSYYTVNYGIFAGR